jgi:hypothetical protein
MVPEPFRKRGYAKGSTPKRRINGIALSKLCFKIEFKGKRFEKVLIEGNLRPPTGRVSAPTSQRGQSFRLCSRVRPYNAIGRLMTRVLTLVANSALQQCSGQCLPRSAGIGGIQAPVDAPPAGHGRDAANSPPVSVLGLPPIEAWKVSHAVASRGYTPMRLRPPGVDSGPAARQCFPR